MISNQTQSTNSLAYSLATNPQRQTILGKLTNKEALQLIYDWRFWARADQLEPAGDWFYWLLLSGRGAGKTRTGAQAVIEYAKIKGQPPIALVGQTVTDVRNTMIELGSSSILRISPPWFMPVYEPSKRRLTWPNGSIAITYSGDKPDQLRGPEHGLAWVDELAKFQYPDETMDNLELGLRVGKRPRAIVTTTPRPIKVIKAIRADERTVTTTVSTYANAPNLSSQFIARIRDKYEGTRLGRQEIYAHILDDNPNALWAMSLIDRHRVTSLPYELYRIVIAIDPHATSGQTGIVVAGVGYDHNRLKHCYVLEDVSSEEGAKPAQWASAAISAYHKWEADLIVAEINHGGDMIESVIRNVPGGIDVAYKAIRATRGKYVRAEPISNLYEQGKVHHIGYHGELETELTEWEPGMDSPNRLDALVWAVTELMVDELQELQVAPNPFEDYRG